MYLFTANISKVLYGAWFPLVIEGVFFTLMLTWAVYCPNFYLPGLESSLLHGRSALFTGYRDPRGARL